MSSLPRALVSLGRGLVGVVLPPACAACDRLGVAPFCRLCGEALEPASWTAIEGADVARARWAYGGPAAVAIQRLKYEGRPELGPSLGAALRTDLATLGPIDFAVPIPLSRRRLRERGYNQARELARGLGLPVLPRALARTEPGREQVGLDKLARFQNLKDAFQPGREPVRGRAIAVVDDVITTGATASAACLALRRAGAVRVVVLAAARTL